MLDVVAVVHECAAEDVRVAADEFRGAVQGVSATAGTALSRLPPGPDEDVRACAASSKAARAAALYCSLSGSRQRSSSACCRSTHFCCLTGFSRNCCWTDSCCSLASRSSCSTT